MNYDPFNGSQTRFQRTDPTGRWSPLHESKIADPWWMAVLGGATIAVLVVIGLAFTIGWSWK